MKEHNYSYIHSADSSFIESLYDNYKASPESIDPMWRKFFEGFEWAMQYVPDKPGTQKISNDSGSTSPLKEISPSQLQEEFNVFQLVESYRRYGHRVAMNNPVQDNPEFPYLDLKNFGLDLQTHGDKEYYAGHFLGLGKIKLRDLLKNLHKFFHGPLSIEYAYIADHDIVDWIEKNFINEYLTFELPVEKKKRILCKLNEAEGLESFLQMKYVGQKRFSLEGAENMVPAMDALVEQAAELGVQEVIIGMAHRGRLNVLANILGKSFQEIFTEFEGKALDPNIGDGDVKYHLGQMSKVKTGSGKEIVLKLMPNPSHLETIGPVAQGLARAKGEILYENDFNKILPFVIHGDSSISGQGVVYETLQMSKLEAYSTNGTIHFVINNQIGFTTPPEQVRSSQYCSSVARTTDAPVIHVNGDDAESIIYAIEKAMEFRQKFKQDIFIDMICYRKYGHNEADEPRYTQPTLYAKLKSHPSPRKIYMEKLIHGGKIDADLAISMEKEFKQILHAQFQDVKENKMQQFEQRPDVEWQSLRHSTPEDFFSSPRTKIKKEMAEQIVDKISTLPENVNPINKAKKIVEDRRKQLDLNMIDWALAEHLCYGSLLLEGHDIRLCGQDAIRGTFSHRHAKVYDEKTVEPYCHLNHLSEGQGAFRVYNSLLSEYAALAFEYGHSLGRAKNLTIWEAQFGDFANGAQIMIDQFISSAESKWQTMTGLVLLLPHGHEGAGPEHSSAKPERYLQLCAEFNMIVANLTTPASFFHIMRRQLCYPFRKPLIVFTPKSLLRHPQCVSTIEDLTENNFEEILPDNFIQDTDEVKRVILCTGKVYYDLLKKQQEDDRKDVAIIRFEQLHPIPFQKLDQILAPFRERAEFCWVQEEPKNMGYWNYILRKLDYYELKIISRKSSASTASGYKKMHDEEQKEIIETAFNLDIKMAKF